MSRPLKIHHSINHDEYIGTQRIVGELDEHGHGRIARSFRVKGSELQQCCVLIPGWALAELIAKYPQYDDEDAT